MSKYTKYLYKLLAFIIYKGLCLMDKQSPFLNSLVITPNWTHSVKSVPEH